VKREKIDPRTKQRIGWEWHRPKGSKNELWDCLIYSSAALDMLAWDYCRKQLELEQVSWPEFWDFAERGAFLTPTPN
jgi:phage terminase large subunit GpA-like protein